MIVDRWQRGEIPLDRSCEVVVIGRLLDDVEARSPASAVTVATGVAELPDARPFGGPEEHHSGDQQHDRKRTHTPRILAA